MAPGRVGYVVKRYPRFSETFIVNEIMAHEAAGLDIEIFSIRPCNDTHFQDTISKVRAPHTLIESARPKADVLLSRIRQASRTISNGCDLGKLLVEEEQTDATTLFQALELAEAVRARHIDHLHAHFATLPAAVTRLASRISGVPYTLTAHAKDIFHESVEPADLSAKLRDASAVVTVSEFNVQHLIAEHGVHPEHVFRVYNGLPLEQFVFESAAERPRTILAVGRLVAKKGFDDLIRACGILRDHQVDFQCQIVGGGANRDQLETLVRDLNLDDHVILTGPIPQARLKNMIRCSAVFAAPCVVSEDGDRDGLPTVLLESMALGTPCVATPVTGIPEIIEPGETGWLVSQRNPAALAESLMDALNNSAKANSFAVAARKVIEREFDNVHTSQQIREVFSLVKSRCASQPELERAN